MNTVVIAFNYVNFKNAKKREDQLTAMRVMSQSPEWAFPISFGFQGNNYVELSGINSLNLLKRNARHGIGTTRDLPYIKEIIDLASQINCKTIGYINSDILLGDAFYEVIQKDFDAYIFSRSDIADTSAEKFCRNDFKVIYGGDQHIGADGFFFKRDWWIENRHLFPDDLIIASSEWDTCYRHIIRQECSNYIEKRVLYHVYHDQKWTNTSVEAFNNIAIWESIK